MRLAGYDWVPETKLKRSLQGVVAKRQSWEESKKQNQKNHLLVTSLHATRRWFTCSVSDRPAWTEEVSGVVIGYCIYERLP